MIKISNLSYKYKFSENVLENINLEINDGEIITIVGKNGTGKSTLAKLISGIIVPKNGEILIDDINTKNKKTKKELRKKIGILFQNPDNQLIFPTVKDDLEFALNNLEINNKENRIKVALNLVDMNDFYEKETYGLSLGQKQRINIAGILAIGTKYIVMDEPTTMIDTIGKDKIHKIIKRTGEKRKIKYIVIHETDNEGKKANAKNHAEYQLKNNETSTSWHYTVDSREIYHHIPDNEIANHAGTYEGNKYGIGIELCVNEDGNFEETFDNATKLVAFLLKEYKLDLEDIKLHHDFSGKDCPHKIISNNRVEEFIKKVETYSKNII